MNSENLDADRASFTAQAAGFENPSMNVSKEL
jgi:hypothetical protein